MEPFWELPFGSQPHFGAKAWDCEPDEAQECLNVPLLLPSEAALPEGLGLSKVTVRPEGERGWANAKLLYRGHGRAIRLKEYHFDWWRPTELTYGLQRVAGFYRAGQCVAAWGRDDKGKAVTRTICGPTTVELRIEQGTFVEIELRQMLSALLPVTPEVSEIFNETPFHHLSYHIRRGRGYRAIDEIAGAQWSESWPATAPSPILLPHPLPPGWVLASVGVWPAPPPEETQWLVRDAEGAIVLYGRARPATASQPLKLPPHYRIQEGWRSRQTLLRRHRMTIASQHPDLGGWSAAWAEGGHRYQIFVRGGAVAGEKGFRALLSSLK